MLIAKSRYTRSMDYKYFFAGASEFLFQFKKNFLRNLKNVITFSGKHISKTKNIDCNKIRTHNHLVCRRTLKQAKWLSVHLRSTWLWVRIVLQPFKLPAYPACIGSRSSLTFRQLQSVDSL